MAHITLSIPDYVYSEMKRNPEIKWSEVARKSIIEKTASLQKTISTKTLLKMLPEKDQQAIRKMDDSAEFFKAVRKKGWKRTKYLIQA